MAYGALPYLSGAAGLPLPHGFDPGGAMSSRDLLEVADDLLGGLKEAHWRSAVSRAYYAAFHEARLLLRRCGFAVPRGEQAHAYLWLRLSNCGHPDLAHAGAELNDLRSQRNWAD
jgi:hypothetical protein